MRRRILIAIVGVTILATAFLTVPLAIVSSLRARSESVRELERVAERVAADISGASLRGGDQIDLPAIESAVSVAVYLRNGTRIAGNGPATADELVKATDRLTRQGTVGSSLVVTRPVVIDEQTKGVIWAAEKLSDTEGRVRHDILLLVAFDLAAIGIAAASGWFLSSRLVAPLELIRDDAVRLGGGDFAIRRRVSGVAELDATSQALSGTAKRLETALHREREFSANASHQLRTPLTALRLSIEGEVLNPRDDRLAVLNESLEEIDRFCAAMIAIRGEIDRVIAGEWPVELSPLRQAPHTAACVVDEWAMPYSRELAVYPVASVREDKYWPPVRRIDSTHVDRNLVCNCPPPEAFEER